MKKERVKSQGISLEARDIACDRGGILSLRFQSKTGLPAHKHLKAKFVHKRYQKMAIYQKKLAKHKN